MKKTYISPISIVTEVEAEALICLSLQNGPADNSTVLGNKRQMDADAANAQPTYGSLW